MIRILLPLAFLACFTLSVSKGDFARMSPAADRPNVLFIAVDDLRPELGCYGAEHVRSPNLDRLAADGLLFERAYCQQSVCNPSRSSLLSGCRPQTTKVFANNIGLMQTMPEVVTLPRHFKDRGYRTLSIGKIFHYSASEPHDVPNSWSEPPIHKVGGTKSWHTEASLEVIKNRPAELAAAGKPPKPGSKAVFRGPPFEAADQPDEKYDDGATARIACETLARIRGEPFFLAVGFVKPHLPFCCPQKYYDLYPPETIKLPTNRALPAGSPSVAGHDWYELRTYGTVPVSGSISDEMALNLIRGYRACTSFVDAQIGRVLDELDRQGLRENTIVVLWGDHGYHLGEHDVWTKMTNFELATRVPLLIRVPGKPAGRRTRALVELVDLYPTLCELCSLEQPSHLEGTSFALLVDKPDQPWKTAAFSEYTRPGDIKGYSIRTDRYRYTEWVDKARTLLGAELYDHETDPAENMNLAADAQHADTVAQLKQALAAGWQSARR